MRSAAGARFLARERSSIGVRTDAAPSTAMCGPTQHAGPGRAPLFRHIAGVLVYDSGERRRWQCPACQWWRDMDEQCKCGRSAPVESL